MEEAALRNPAPVTESTLGGLARDAGLLLVLLVVAAGIRTWLIHHTEVAARDSIGYIRYAWKLEHEPWGEVLLESDQHPGYPVAILAVSLPVRHWLGKTDSATMQLSAQLASALAGVLLVLPMFYLGKELFDRRAGFWAAALFQSLPVSGRILSDGLSEATFLLFMALALLSVVRGLRTHSVIAFALSGLFSGLAYLTRPEGALIVAAGLVVLLPLPWVRASGWPWKRVVLCGASLGLAALAVAVPYMATIGGITPKPTAVRLLEVAGRESRGESFGLLSPSIEDPSVPGGRPLFACIVAVWSMGNGSLWWGVRAVFSEVVKGYFYVGWLPALFGLWWFRDRLRTPGVWVLLVVSLLHGLLIWRLAAVMGYVSERHALLLVLCGIFWAAAGLAALGTYFSGRRAWITPVLLSLLAGGGLVATLKPLHANRAGHHAAGLWLAKNATSTDRIYDPFCWAHFYAGRVLAEGTTPVTQPDRPPLYYVVLEALTPDEFAHRQKLLPRLFPSLVLDRSDNHEHTRLPMIAEAQQIASRGQIVFHWPVESPVDRSKVLVYAVNPH